MEHQIQAKLEQSYWKGKTRSAEEQSTVERPAKLVHFKTGSKRWLSSGLVMLAMNSRALYECVEKEWQMKALLNRLINKSGLN